MFLEDQSSARTQPLRRSTFLIFSFLTGILVGLTIEYIYESSSYKLAGYFPPSSPSRLDGCLGIPDERGHASEAVGADLHVSFSSNRSVTNHTETLLITSNASSFKNVLGINKFGCPNHEYTQGYWERRQQSTKPMDSTSTEYFWKVEQRNTSSDSCRLEFCDKETFCEVLRGRSVLIVGDSINLQFYAAMRTFLFASDQQAHQFKQFGNRLHPVHMSARICNSSTSRLTFVRNDNLETTSVLTQSGIPWMYMLPSHEVLFLNTGAHAHSIGEYKSTIENLRYLFFQNKNYTGSVWFRTTPRGHPGCSKNDTVIAKANDEDWNRYFSPESHEAYPRYNYDQFPAYNKIVIDAFGDRALDVATMTELRPDNHRIPPTDCLHYKESFRDVFFEWIKLFCNGLRGHLS